MTGTYSKFSCLFCQNNDQSLNKTPLWYKHRGWRQDSDALGGPVVSAGAQRGRPRRSVARLKDTAKKNAYSANSKANDDLKEREHETRRQRRLIEIEHSPLRWSFFYSAGRNLGPAHSSSLDVTARPRGFLRSQGCHFGWCWGHFRAIFEVKVMPTSLPKFVAFSNVEFVGIWCVLGCIVVRIFVVFRGLQRRIAKNLDM